MSCHNIYADPFKVYAISGQSLDAASTIYLLSNEYKETNPLLPKSKTGIVAVKSIYTSLSIVGIKKIQKKHPKLAKFLYIIVGTSGFIPAAINFKRLKDGRMVQ